MILIFSRFSDIHAAAVKWALKENDVECEIIDMYGVIAGGMIALDDDMDTLSWRSMPDGINRSLKISEIDGVWLRRLDGDRFDVSWLHQDDVKVAEENLKYLATALYGLLGQRARHSVNGMESRYLMELKPVQLAAARRAGLSTPRTLITNDPDKVKDFILANQRTIYKGFEQSAWFVDGRRRVQSTCLVDMGLLGNAASIALTPGIYQSYAEKAFELRLTVMGDEIHAAKLDSQAVPVAKVDWKCDSFDEMPVTPFDVPADVHEKIMNFMGDMKLRFGCIDIVVTPSGEYVFLEVNPQGQFLWVEQRNPEIELLAAFSRFLCREAGIAWQAVPVSLDGFKASGDYQHFIDASMARFPIAATIFAQETASLSDKSQALNRVGNHELDLAASE